MALDGARSGVAAHVDVNLGLYQFRFEFVMIATVECVFAALMLMKGLSHIGYVIGAVKERMQIIDIFGAKSEGADFMKYQNGPRTNLIFLFQ